MSLYWPLYYSHARVISALSCLGESAPIDPPCYSSSLSWLCESAQLHIDTESDPQAVWECSYIQSILSWLTLMLLLTLFLSGACHQPAGCSATTYIGKLWPQHTLSCGPLCGLDRVTTTFLVVSWQEIWSDNKSDRSLVHTFHLGHEFDNPSIPSIPSMT